MQEYREVLETDTVRDAREIWNKNMETLRSTHAGEAFPTENLALGMKCFRSDEKKTYTLVSLDPVEWKVEASGKSTIDREDIVSAQAFLDFVGHEALGRLTDWTGLFYRGLSIEVVDFSDLGRGTNVTNMSRMFANCASLKTVLNFNVSEESPLTDVHGMFDGCDHLTALDTSKFAAKKVENFSEMFKNCRALKTIDAASITVDKATTLYAMFYGCQELRSLDVSKWNVSNVTSFAELFRDCPRLRGLDLTKWNTAKATGMGGMFRSCGNETITKPSEKNQYGYYPLAGAPIVTLALDLSSFDLTNVTTTAYMFAYARAELTIGEKMRKTGKCKDMSGMFLQFSCKNPPVIAGAKYTSPVTGKEYPQTIFTAFDFSSAESMGAMFEGTCAVNAEVKDGKETKYGLVFHVATPKAQDISGMFRNTQTDFIYLSMDTGKATNIRSLFANSTAECIRLRNFDTRNINFERYYENASSGINQMFKGCNHLKYLIIDDTTFMFKLAEDVLADLPKDCRFVVPRNMIPVYTQQEYWKNYASRFIALQDCVIDEAYVKNAP